MVHLNHFHRLFLQLTVLLTVSVTSAVAGVIPLFNPADPQLYENSFSLKANTYLTNDPFTLKDLLLNGMKGKEHARSGDNIALAVERASFGYGDRKYGYIAYVYREEIFFKMTKDTVDLIYEATNKIDLKTGRNYNLYLLLKAYKMQGIAYSNSICFYKKNGWKMYFGGSVELLYASEMQDGYVRGNAIANTSKDYSFFGVSNYNYTHNYLYDLNVNASDAYGFSTHFSLSAQKGKFHFLFLANDLFSRLYWSALPYSDVLLSSDNKEYDAEGYVKYKPLLKGKDGYTKYQQALMQKYRFHVAYSYNNRLCFSMGSDYMESVVMPYGEARYKFTKDFSLKMGYETRFGAVTLLSRYKNITIGLTADDLFKPSTMGLSLKMVF